MSLTGRNNHHSSSSSRNLRSDCNSYNNKNNNNNRSCTSNGSSSNEVITKLKQTNPHQVRALWINHNLHAQTVKQSIQKFN